MDTDASPASSIELRRRLVQHLRQRGCLHDRRIAEAFLAVPRELFLSDYVEGVGLAAVYHDEAIVIQRDPISGVPLSSSSQPAIMALMLQMLDVHPGHRVVEIGAGTGYNAALLHLLAEAEGMVVTLDIDPDLASRSAAALTALGANVHVVVADGRLGLPGAAPVDRIEVTASSSEVPRAWYDQLCLGGKLVVPLRLSASVESTNAVTAFQKVPGGFDSVAVTPGGFMPLRPSMGSAKTPASDSATVPQPCPESLEPPSNISGQAVSELRIAVRYTADPPDARWTSRRADHWIGVDVT
jgi:protein-L-isoaspartate(D-aspartate) O-methyltransferase